MKLLIIVIAVVYKIAAQNDDFFSALEGDIKPNSTNIVSTHTIALLRQRGYNLNN